jgi:hypothetical protein
MGNLTRRSLLHWTFGCRCDGIFGALPRQCCGDDRDGVVDSGLRRRGTLSCGGR